MTVQTTDSFLVQRGTTQYHVTAANVDSKIQDTDILLVQRGTTQYKITGAVFKSAAFQDGDLYIVNRAGVDYKATGALVKGILKKAPIIQVVTLSEDSSAAPAFTSQAFTVTITMQEPGMPVAARKLKAWIEGDLSTQLISTNTITSVTPGVAGASGTVEYGTAATHHVNVHELLSVNAKSVVYGKPAQDANQVLHPAFIWAKGLTISGHNDWYIPAKFELDILLRNLKPAGGITRTKPEANRYAVPPAPSADVPQTTAAQFQAGNSEAFNYFAYWSATEHETQKGYAWTQEFKYGKNTVVGKNAKNRARAIRRIPIAEYLAAGSPAIGASLGGGYYAGQISTAGNGVADYALIVAPRAYGEYGVVISVQASLTISGAQTDGFKAGEGITPPSGTPSTGIVAVDDTKVDVNDISGFNVGDKIYGMPKVTRGARLYLKFDAAGAVSDLQAADPGYVQTTNQSAPKLTFPATLPSGRAPDAELPAGTTLTVEVQASNTSGTVTKASTTITPAR